MNTQNLSKVIREAMSSGPKRMSQPELARISGVSQSTINRILNNDTDNPGYFNVIALMGALGLSHSDIESGRIGVAESRASYDQPGPGPAAGLEDLGYVLVPRFEVTAGMGNGDVIHSEQVTDHLAFKSAWVRAMGLNVNHIACIRCRGDSMETTIRDGAIALLDLRPKTTDGVFALARPGLSDEAELLVKRLTWRQDGGLEIRSDNRQKFPDPEVYPPGFDLAQLRIIGQVRWAGNEIF